MRIREGTHNMDCLISSVKIHFNSNLEDLHDFTALCLKEFYNVSIQELYQVFHIVWHRIAGKLVHDFGKNHPIIIHVGSSVKNALMDCHQLVPLPNDGPALRASIVATFRDEYGVNWERFLDNMEQWRPKDQKHLEPLSATYKRDALMEAGPSKPLHLEAEDTHRGEKRSAKDTPSEESDEYEDAVEEFKSESEVS